MPFKKLVYVLFIVAYAMALQEQPTPYDLIRPVWPLTWDESVFDKYDTSVTKKKNMVPKNRTPASYAPNELIPDTLNQAYLDAINVRMSPIRINQAGYMESDPEKQFYYVGNATTFEVVDINGKSLSPAVTGTFTSSGTSISSDWTIVAGTNAATNDQQRYKVNVTGQSGNLQIGNIPGGLPTETRLRIKVGNDISSTFIISERVYSMVRSAALKFYGINRSGNGESWFHPASHTKDGGGPIVTGSDDVRSPFDASLAGTLEGGYYDCGDHLKESQTQMYAFMVSAVLAATNADADEDNYAFNHGETVNTDGIPDMLREAKHGADFVLRSFVRAKGVIDDMALSVGNFGADHGWWGRPENQDKLPVDNSAAATDRGGPGTRTVRLGEIGANIGGETAAGLALLAKDYAMYDKPFADSCLMVAEKMYDFAKNLAQGKGTYDGGKPFKNNTIAAGWSSPAYNGNNEFYDDLALASVALLYATGKKEYADDMIRTRNLVQGQEYADGAGFFQGGWFVTNNKGFFKDVKNTSWANAYSYALYALYKLILADKNKAINEYGLTEDEWLNAIEDCIVDMIANVGDMSFGQGTASIQLPSSNNNWKPSSVRYDPIWYTMMTDQTWIYNRYQAGNIFEVLAYADVASDIEKKGIVLPSLGSPNWNASEMHQLGINQLNYMLGVNPWDVSFILGIGDKNDAHPHHRAANPEGKNMPGANYKYNPPVGALFGGVAPGLTNSWVPSTMSWEDYHLSETCIDAAATLVSAGMLASKKIDKTMAPDVFVEIRHVSMDSALVVVKLTRRGTAALSYGMGDSHKDMNLDAEPDNKEPGVIHEIVLRDLKPGTTYYFYALGMNEFEMMNATIKYQVDSTQTPFSFTTLNTIESADIQNVTVCNVSADSAEVMWYTPNGEYESKVYWDTQPHSTAVEFAFNTGSKNADVSLVPTKFHYVKIGNLKEKTQYYFMVESNGQFANVEAETGVPLKFTTPVTQYNFSVATYQYPWQDMALLNFNVHNNEARAFDSLTIRLFMRGNDSITTDIGMGTDICQAYDEAGFNKPCSDETKEQLERALRDIQPIKIEDTYDAASGTWQWYFPLELGSTVIKSSSRLRFDVRFDHRSPWPPYKDLMNEAPNKKLYCKSGNLWYFPSDEFAGAQTLTQNPGDWSFMPHSKINGDYADYPGMPCINKDEGDIDFDVAPINPFVAVYRKDEFVWGYSPSKSEMQTKRAKYQLDVTYDAPFNVSNGSYVEVDQTSKTVHVKGHAHITEGGFITQIWANGSKLETEYTLLDNESYLTYKGDIVAHYNMATDLWELDIPVRMSVGSNKIDVTVFAGPDPTCTECLTNGGCAFDNRNYYVLFNRPNMSDGILTVKDINEGTVGNNGVVDPNSRQQFYVYLTDLDKANFNSSIMVNVINKKKQDTLKVIMNSLGDGKFRSSSLITAVSTSKENKAMNEISFFAGDTIYVTYQDPDDEEDYSQITAFFAESNYPTPQKVLALDSDCDNKADKLLIQFSNTLDESYSFTQMKVFMDGMTDTVKISVPQPVLGLSEIIVPLDPVLGISANASPSGNAVIFLTENGITTEESIKISDGIAPQLLSVTILENPNHESEYDTVMIAFTEPVELQSLTTWPLSIVSVDASQKLNVVGKATTNTNGKSWQYIISGNDKGAYIPVNGIASIVSGFNITDNNMIALDPTLTCINVTIAETPKPVGVKIAEMRDFEGDGFADEIYIRFEKRLRPKDMLDSFIVDWGMQSVVKSFVTKTDTSEGIIKPLDSFWTIEDSVSLDYEKWIDSLTKITTRDTFSIIKISLNPQTGFDEGLTSGAYDGYGHITPRLGPEGGFFDKNYFVVDKCPPVIMSGKTDTTGAFTSLTVVSSEPLTLIENEQLEYIERMRGRKTGVFLRNSVVKQSFEKQIYTYKAENDDAIQAGDSIRFPILASRYKDVAGNLPSTQNPWRIVTGAVGKMKFEVTLRESVTKPNRDGIGYGIFEPSVDEHFRFSIDKEDKEQLMQMWNNSLMLGSLVDSLSYRHSGPVFKLDITLPSVLVMDTINGQIQNKNSVEVELSLEIFDNIGQYINSLSIVINSGLTKEIISPDGIIHLNLEWISHDVEAPVSKAGKKIATGVYIAKFEFKAKETDLKTLKTTTTRDDATKTFGFKRAKKI